MGQHSRTGIWLLTALLAVGLGSGLTSAAAAEGTSAPIAAAQNDSPAPGGNLITCWYDANKQPTGATDPLPGVSAGTLTNTGHGGKHAWAYTMVYGSCPSEMPTSAGQQQRTASLITCWYNGSKQSTGADTAATGVKAGGPVRTGNGGDYTWAYTIEAPDGTSCPHTIPAPAAESNASLITCWYNDSKQSTGADSAATGVKAGGPVRTGHGGDYAWAYTIEAPDGTSCPHTMPAPKGRK